MTGNNPSNKPAWVQLYEARQNMVVEAEARTPGRPPAPVPRHKYGVTLSQSEINELTAWQERISTLLRRKVSLGETIGILTRISSARLARLAARSNPQSLVELVDRMIGE
jgi:hypothetical protein